MPEAGSVEGSPFEVGTLGRSLSLPQAVTPFSFRCCFSFLLLRGHGALADGPDEADELSCNRCRCDRGTLASTGQANVLPMQSVIGCSRDGQHFGRLLASSLLQSRTGARCVLILPNC